MSIGLEFNAMWQYQRVYAVSRNGKLTGQAGYASAMRKIWKTVNYREITDKISIDV